MLYQWTFKISGLIPKQVKLKRKIWLKKGELVLDKKGDDLYAYLLGTNEFSDEKRISPYLWMSSLITNNTTELTNRGGSSISSKDELGVPQSTLSIEIVDQMSKKVVEDIEKHTHKFLGFIGRLHDKYINVINENKFLFIALDYFHDSINKSIYSDEGFISAMVSLESLFNEGNGDITYKISHRASFLLSLSDMEPTETFENLKKFYKHRSLIVHGREYKDKKLVVNKNLLSIYTRKVIIIFLILLNNTERQGIRKDGWRKKTLMEIDYAMLDIKKRKVLEREIKKGLKGFELKIPRVFEVTEKGGKYRRTAW